MNAMIVFGIAEGVKNEVASLPSYAYDYMAVGMDALEVLPVTLKYVVTNHPEDMMFIKQYRQRKYKKGGFKILSSEDTVKADIILSPPYEGPPGSSSITGVLMALKFGYKKIILCGCPLSGISPSVGCRYESFRDGWTYHLDKFLGKVKSTSGWTQFVLGAPTQEWFNE